MQRLADGHRPLQRSVSVAQQGIIRRAETASGPLPWAGLSKPQVNQHRAVDETATSSKPLAAHRP